MKVGEVELAARILGAAFSEDEPLLRALRLRPQELSELLFKPFLRMILAGEPSFLLLEDEVGALVAMRSDWHPSSPKPSYQFLWNILKRGRLLTLLGMLRFSAAVNKHTAPPELRWRLLYVGVVPEARGRGVATRLIERLFERTEGLPVQLEVEANNPAVRLYKKLGFEVEKEFRAAGVRWFVMVRRP